MKFIVLKVGKISYDEITELSQVYLKRLFSYAAVLIKELKNNDALLKELQKSDAQNPYVCLHEKGKELTTVEFSKLLNKWNENGQVKSIYFIIGDPMGISKDILDKALLNLSLSKLTFTSDLAYLLLVEQLYRALSILKGSKYHHE
jgi:23S rRNA (pseudouridine1915-N3)-methyltransferase